MSEQNGKDDGWVIALVGGRTLVGVLGLPTTGPGVGNLSPVYELQAHAQQEMTMGPRGPVPTGRTNIGQSAAPVLLLASFDSLELPSGIAIKRLRELSAHDRNAVMTAVKAAEKLANDLRLASTGLAAPGPAELKAITERARRG